MSKFLLTEVTKDNACRLYGDSTYLIDEDELENRLIDIRCMKGSFNHSKWIDILIAPAPVPEPEPLIHSDEWYDKQYEAWVDEMPDPLDVRKTKAWFRRQPIREG